MAASSKTHTLVKVRDMTSVRPANAARKGCPDGQT